MKILITSTIIFMNLLSFLGFAQSPTDKKNIDKELYKVLPILKVKLDFNDTSKTISIPEKYKPVMDTFLSDLVILYAIDNGTAYQIISNEKMKTLKLTQSNLKELAINNLNNLLHFGEVQMHGDTSFAMLTFDGNNEANLILLNDFWTDIDQLYNRKDFYVALPSRDVLLIASTDSEIGINQMKDKINKVIKTGDHSLTRWIFIRKNKKLEPYIKIIE